MATSSSADLESSSLTHPNTPSLPWVRHPSACTLSRTSRIVITISMLVLIGLWVFPKLSTTVQNATITTDNDAADTSDPTFNDLVINESNGEGDGDDYDTEEETTTTTTTNNEQDNDDMPLHVDGNTLMEEPTINVEDESEETDDTTHYQYDASDEEFIKEENRQYPELANLTHLLDREAAKCAQKYIDALPENSVARQIKLADCGLGYDFSGVNKKRWRVVLYGFGFDHGIFKYSGCPNDGKCLNNPHCRINSAKTESAAREADVVVVFQKEPEALNRMTLSKDVVTVLYYREAKWHFPGFTPQKHLFDIEMGVHYYSGVLNPHFVKTPTMMMESIVPPHSRIPFVPLHQRTGFALSIISDCDAPSHRQIYIDHLTAYLGASRVHQYGKCGNRELPPKPFKNAAKVVARYKFYFAFENTIQDGYCTEKLFTSLTLPVIPVYYGALNAPNVTKSPSYIKASDFRNPKELAKYLLFLDQHDDEYMKYHKWRSDPSQFTDEYLETLQKRIPGPREEVVYRDNGYDKFPRTAACCRLCDPEYVAWQVSKRRVPDDLVRAPLNVGAIERQFFHGTGMKIPGGNALLVKSQASNGGG